MSGVELLWAVSPGKVAALIAASGMLGALLAYLMAMLLQGDELDEFEEAEE